MSKISVKGDLREGIKIIVNPNLNWEEIKELVKEEIKKREKFFKKSHVYLDLQGKDIGKEEWYEFQKEILEKYGIMLSKELIRLEISSANTAKIVLGPIRSGRLLTSRDNLLIIGDVNSGSEVVCHKSIFVLGKVRGSIWAGYGNNEKATIFALELEPERVQIANCILDLSLINNKDKKLGYWIYLEDRELKVNLYSGGK